MLKSLYIVFNTFLFVKALANSILHLASSLFILPKQIANFCGSTGITNSSVITRRGLTLLAF
jgi:hypothetical protein